MEEDNTIRGFYTGCVKSGNIGDDILFYVFLNFLKKTIISKFGSNCKLNNCLNILDSSRDSWIKRSNIGVIGGGSLIHPEEISYTFPVTLIDDYLNNALIFGTGISDTPNFRIPDRSRKKILEYDFSNIEFPVNNLFSKNLEIIKKIKNGNLRGPIDNKIAGLDYEKFSYDPGLIAGKYIDYNKRERDNKSIGINLCHVTGNNRISKKNEDFKEYTDRIISEISIFCDFCLNKGYNLYFYSMSDGEEHIHNEVVSKLKYEGKIKDRINIYNYMPYKDLLSVMSGLRFTVSLRLHGSILSNSVLTPSINMIYNFKSINYLESTDQRLLGIPTNEKLNSDSLISKLIYIEKNYENIVKNLNFHIDKADLIHSSSLYNILKKNGLKSGDRYIIDFSNIDTICSAFKIKKEKNMKYNFTPTQDWHFYFSKIFENIKIKNMIEFGLGVGTPYLADNCEYLKSVELSLGSYNLDWYEKTKNAMSKYKNWESEYIEVNNNISDANDRAQRLRFPLEDVEYLKDLNSIFLSSMGNKKYDFIFIDAGIHTRGDLVNMSFGNSDIIAAHDTSRDPKRVLENVYGYNIVEVPEDYEEIHFEDTYMGTTIWIKKNMRDLIEILRDYKVEI